MPRAPDTPSLAIELEHVSVLREAEANRKQPVLSDLSLFIPAGERVALVGRNGAGKTSMLLALVGALPTTGRIRIGELVLERRTLASIRRMIGFVFADPSDQLFCATVAEEVSFGPKQLGLAPERIEARVRELLDLVRLRGFEARSPTRLSLGEQRRLAIAAALATRPGVLLIDEPTAALDPVARRNLLTTIRALDATVVIATHDLDAVLELDARSVLLDRAGIAADGPARELLRDQALLERTGLAARGS